MKKSVLFVLLLCLLVALSGCGNDDYAVERNYWKVQKQASNIFKNPHATPPKELERVIKLLSGLAQKYPNTQLAISAEFTIAKLYIIKEEYDQSRKQLKKLGSKYNKSKDLIAESLFLAGNSYEIQGKWAAALEQYRRIMNEYPETVRGIDIPVYIAQHYKIKYEPEKMYAAYNEAVGYYKSIAARHPDSPLAYNLNLLAARCSTEIKDWQAAIDTFKTMLVSYKGKVNLDAIMLNIAGIYFYQLNNKDAAKKILGQLLNEYPKTNLKKFANEMLKDINKNE